MITSLRPRKQLGIWAQAIVALTAHGIVSIDQMMTDALIPTLAADLNVSVSSASLTLTLYLISAASTIILFGKLSDHYGRKLWPLILVFAAFAGAILAATSKNRNFKRYIGAIGKVAPRQIDPFPGQRKAGLNEKSSPRRDSSVLLRHVEGISGQQNC